MKSRSLTMWGMVIVLITTVNVWAAVTQVYSDKDTWIEWDSGLAGRSFDYTYGTDPYHVLWSYKRSFAAYTQAILGFDLTSITGEMDTGDTLIIESITLTQHYIANEWEPADVYIAVGGQDSSWNPGTTTWLNSGITYPEKVGEATVDVFGWLKDPVTGAFLTQEVIWDLTIDSPDITDDGYLALYMYARPDGVNQKIEFHQEDYIRNSVQPDDQVARLDITYHIIPAIPAPSAILLGSIGIGCVSWLLRRKRML